MFILAVYRNQDAQRQSYCWAGLQTLCCWQRKCSKRASTVIILKIADKPQHVNISEIIAKRNIYAPDRQINYTYKNDSNPKVQSPLAYPVEKDNFCQNLSNAFRSGGN